MRKTTMSSSLTQGSYKVTSIHGNQASRLLEMGITPGITLQLIRSAPTGFPIEVKLRGYLLSLRKSEAECIEVEY